MNGVPSLAMPRATRTGRLAAALLSKEQSDASRRPAADVDLMFADGRSLVDDPRRREFEARRGQQQRERVQRQAKCSRSVCSPTTAGRRLCGSDQRSKMRLAAEQASWRCLVTAAIVSDCPAESIADNGMICRAVHRDTVTIKSGRSNPSVRAAFGKFSLRARLFTSHRPPRIPPRPRTSPGRSCTCNQSGPLLQSCYPGIHLAAFRPRPHRGPVPRLCCAASR